MSRLQVLRSFSRTTDLGPSLAPRRGDLAANMLRSELWSTDTPGMLDYMRIPAPYEQHPCFPARVMCVVGSDIVPRCRIDCPSERAVSPATSPVAGPSGTNADHPSPSLSSQAFSPPWSSEIVALPSPILMGSGSASRATLAARSLPALQLTGLRDDDDYECSTSSSLGSPMDVWIPVASRTRGRTGASNTTSAVAPSSNHRRLDEGPSAVSPARPPLPNHLHTEQAVDQVPSTLLVVTHPDSQAGVPPPVSPDPVADSVGPLGDRPPAQIVQPAGVALFHVQPVVEQTEDVLVTDTTGSPTAVQPSALPNGPPVSMP